MLQEAFKIMELEMGRPLEAVFSSISAEPIAAASLGQVYRAKLRATGAEVAVKVSVKAERGRGERECGWRVTEV